MGLFDGIKKTKNAKWTVNKKPTLIELHDTSIHCTSSAKEFDIFYLDIKNIEKQVYVIKIKTTVDDFKFTPRKIRGAKDLADEMYDEIVEKMRNVKQ